jgi:hypothetical protein
MREGGSQGPPFSFWFAGKITRPLHGTVQDAQDVDVVARYPIGGDVGRAVDYQLARAAHPAFSPHLRKPNESSAGLPYPVIYLDRGRRVVLIDISIDCPSIIIRSRRPT